MPARNRPSQPKRPAVRVVLACALAIIGLGSPIRTTSRAAVQRTPLDDLLERAGRYVVDFETRFSTLVAEERYVQDIKTGRPTAPGGPEFEARELPGDSGDSNASRGASYSTKREKQTGPRHRVMKSDVLLVQVADTTWFCFRDVIEVDGQRVRNREGRLQELFVTSRGNTRQVMDESARYNIGNIERNNNVPTYALLILYPGVSNRFVFKQTGEQDVGGTRTWVLSFAEVARPTIVRNRRDQDVPSSGHFWIDPKTGHVLMSQLIVGDATSDARAYVTVKYRLDEKLGTLVPAEMREIYDQPTRPWDVYIECTATYSNFRRFQVTTDETIKVPK